MAHGHTLVHAGRMVLVASGEVKHEEVVAHATKAFASLPADSTSAESLVASDPSHFTGSSVSVRDPDMTKTGLAVAFKGAGHLDPDAVTLTVMANMLGTWSQASGTSIHQRSKLATKVAANGLADKIMGFNTPYHDTGLFGVYAQTSKPEEIEDLSWCIMNVRLLCLWTQGQVQCCLSRGRMSCQGPVCPIRQSLRVAFHGKSLIPSEGTANHARIDRDSVSL
jgi:hypothetical protein